MKAFWTVALVTLLAGCGTAPQMAPGAAPSGTASTSGLFSSFKESNYTQTVTVKDLFALQNDEAANRASAGKRLKVTGDLGYSIGDMQLVDLNDVALTLTGEGGGYSYIHRARFITRKSALSFVDKVGGDLDGQSTVYLTIKTGNIHGRLHVDAIKRPDGKIVTL